MVKFGLAFFLNFLPLPSRPKLLQKNSLQRKCFGANNFVKITKESLYKAHSLACFLAKRDTPVAATLQRKSSGGIIFVIITKIITKENVPRNYFVIISARMVSVLLFLFFLSYSVAGQALTWKRLCGILPWSSHRLGRRTSMPHVLCSRVAL